MTIEVVRTIASLCMVAAGDKNDVSSVVTQIENSQVECHRHYAKCYKQQKDWEDCILSRETEHEKFIKGLKK